MARLFRVVVVLLLTTVCSAQSETAQQWDSDSGTWVNAPDGDYDGTVTTQTMGQTEYWVLLDSNNKKVWRIRKDDDSISAGEKDDFECAEIATDGTKIRVECKTRRVHSTMKLPPVI